MGGIAKRAEIRIVRRDNHDAPAGGKQPVELFHRADDIRDMLEHVNRPYFAKRVVAKRKREVI